MVRRLPLEQEILGSSPSPATIKANTEAALTLPSLCGPFI